MIEISRSKLMPKVLVGLAVLVTIFGLTTTASAGIPPFTYEYFQYDLISYGYDVEIEQDEPCLWLVAGACTEEEIELEWFPEPPFNHKLFIDGRKIALRRFAFIDEDGSWFGYPGTKWWVFYHVFEAGYFDVGVYNIVHENLVQKPYGGSEIYGWRPFINFVGPVELYGPVGMPWILSYTLTVT